MEPLRYFILHSHSGFDRFAFSSLCQNGKTVDKTPSYSHFSVLLAHYYCVNPCSHSFPIDIHLKASNEDSDSLVLRLGDQHRGVVTFHVTFKRLPEVCTDVPVIQRSEQREAARAIADACLANRDPWCHQHRSVSGVCLTKFWNHMRPRQSAGLSDS